MADDVAEGSEGKSGFEWSPAKRQRVLKGRKIDFVDAAKGLLGPVYEFRSDRHSEERFVAIGPLLDGTLIVIVYTIRDSKIRIITA